MSDNNPYSDYRTLGLRVSFQMSDTAVNQTSFTFSATTTNSLFSDINQIVDEISVMSGKFATNEQNYGWKLDGTYNLISENGENGELGWWANTRAASSGSYSTTQWIRINMSIPLHSQTITVVFDQNTNVYAKDFDVEVYNSSLSLVQTINVRDNNLPVAVVEMPDVDYKRIRIGIKKMNQGYRMARVTEVLFGAVTFFTDDDVSEIRLQYETSLMSDSLPSNMAEITINNLDRRYNINNPAGIYKYLQEGQAINVALIVNNQYYNMGLFYFVKAESEENSMLAKITGYDKFYVLDTIPCNIGATGTWTVTQAVEAVIEASGQKIDYSIPTAIGSLTINKCIPENTTCREALRLIAQAAKCVCFFDKINVLRFINPTTITGGDVLNADRMLKYPVITDTGLINNVELTVRNDFDDTENTYTANDRRGTEPLLSMSVDNPLVYDGQGVADWILQMCKYRMGYDIGDRGNPSRNCPDKINVTDGFGNSKDVISLSQEYNMRIGLNSRIKGVSQ